MGIGLLNSIRQLAGWPESPGPQLMDLREWRRLRDFSGLTQREYEVCRLIFHGETRQAAAESLGIADRTVRYHLEAAYSKLSVTNRVELVLRLIQIRDHLKRQARD
ncbi:MAG: helix-turn-helix transcriptional regulator [Planctomycetota bacterium]